MIKLRRRANPFDSSVNAEAAHPAGRDRELKEVAKALGAIADAPRHGIASWNGMAYQPIQLYGPSGSGKTVLLMAARRIAEEHGIHVVSVTSLPDLHPDGELGKGVLAGTEMAALPAYLRDMLAQIKQLRKRPEGLVLSDNQQWNVVRQGMEACAQRRPTAFLMDHVTDYDIKSLRRFLLCYDSMFIGRRPLALVLAGTPGMFRTLDRTNVGLMDRSAYFNLAALEPAAAREALERPFEERGVKVLDGALELMADMADDYPQFIKIVGHEVWKTWASADRDEVDRELVSQARAGIQRKREAFYQGICRRIRTAGLVGRARHVMELLRLKGGRTTRSAIIRSLADGFAENGHRKGVDVCYEMMDLGFIWANGPWMEAGIPGLFDYCERYERKGASSPAE